MANGYNTSTGLTSKNLGNYMYKLISNEFIKLKNINIELIR